MTHLFLSCPITADEGVKQEVTQTEETVEKHWLFKVCILIFFPANSTRIICTVHLYANGTALVQPQYQHSLLWYSKQTFVSLLCCQHPDNEATGTHPANPRLRCSLKTPLITNACKPSHLVKCLSQPITSESIASVITLICQALWAVCLFAPLQPVLRHCGQKVLHFLLFHLSFIVLLIGNSLE